MSASWSRPVLLGLVAVAVVGALVFVTARAGGSGTPSLDDRTMAVAAGLRCPVCTGESVAASSSSAATQMRGEIRRQLAEGRTPDEIRSWFAARYGSGVLLTPPASGIGLLAWVLPLAALLGGIVLLVHVSRRGDVGELDDLEGAGAS